MKKKLLSALLCTAMAASMLAGCSSGTETTTEPAATEDTATEDAAATEDTAAAEDTATEETAAAEDDGLLVYGIYKSGDQTWFLDEGEAAKQAVEAQGGEFIYVDVKLSPEEYLKALDNAIANKADGVVTCTPDQTMSQAVVDKMNEAGIPVVACDDALEVNGEKLVPWVGINAYAIGAINGEWLANYAIENDLVNDPECGLLLMTMDTVSSCVPRTEGEYDKFTELCPEFDTSRIWRADGDGTTDKGNTGAAAVITAHPEIKKWLVTGGNEESCIGAVRALESAGLDKDACVVGLGAYMAKDEWNTKGAEGTCMKASTYFSSDSVGAGSIDVLMQMINGEEPPMETAVDAVIVTPENYKEVMGDAAN